MTLALRGTIDNQLSAQQFLTDVTSESYRLYQARYEKGVESYLQVLDSRRALYGAQQNLIGVRLLNVATLWGTVPSSRRNLHFSGIVVRGRAAAIGVTRVIVQLPIYDDLSHTIPTITLTGLCRIGRFGKPRHIPLADR